MQQSFYHGRLIANPFDKSYALGPNLDLAARADDAYEQEFTEESDHGQKDGILKAQRNFLRDVVYFLYENNRNADAAKWYKKLGDKFPDKGILDGQPESYPRTMTVDDYAFERVQQELSDTSQPRMTSVVQGLLVRAYIAMAMDQNDRYAGLQTSRGAGL